MIAKAVRTLLFLGTISHGVAEMPSEWKLVSKGDRGIERRWFRPARNSCEVDFRDLQRRDKTSLLATIGYLPHKAVKQSSETETVQLDIGVSGLATEHIVECEEVLAVSVSKVNRE